MEDGKSQEEEFRIRAVTSFIQLKPDDFQSRATFNEETASKKRKTETAPSTETESKPSLHAKVSKYAIFLKDTEKNLTKAGYEVQTLRIATNPFGEYLAPATDAETLKAQLSELDGILKSLNIEFCSLGPAATPDQVDCCPYIVSTSHRLSCSAALMPGNTIMANRTAECMKAISHIESPSHMKKGLGNFQFCASACCKPFTPFFPCAKSPSLSDSTASLDEEVIHFAIALENGKLANRLLSESKTVDNISSIFRDGVVKAITPLYKLCESVSNESNGKVNFVGIDTSLNPSLDAGGSVAAAIEQIDIVDTFGGRGSVAVAAEITKALNSLPGISNVGYSGLMLPVMEDRRLADLANSSEIDTTRLLGISSVCGVGLDTIPVSGSASTEELVGLILDVASLAFRYEKALTCRLLLCPGQHSGMAEMNSPYMCDCKIFSI